MTHKILIVDDDAVAREGLARLLTDAGFETVTAGTVPDAMRVLATGEVDLLITEIRVDEYNGLHLIAMAPQPVPAIVITAYADAAVEADARRLGAEYLHKPVLPDALHAVIRSTLASAAARGVFLPARREARTAVTAGPAISVNDTPARLLDVSAGGARVEVRCTVGASVPPAVTLRFDEAQFSVPLDVAWKRRQSETSWVCGVAVPEDLRAQWRTFIGAVLTGDASEPGTA